MIWDAAELRAGFREEAGIKDGRPAQGTWLG